MASTQRFAEAALGSEMALETETVAPAETPLPAHTPRLRPTETVPAPPAAVTSAAPLEGTATPPSDIPPDRPVAPAPSGTEAILRQVVSELTGYPDGMLGMEMDLESDLGIDSIKRVEILSALEERLGVLPNGNPETMAQLKTLGQVAEFMGASPSASSGDAATAPPVAPRPAISGKADDKVAAILVRVVSELTGYPPDMLSLEMNVESDLGIDSIKRVEILSALEERLPDLPAVTPEEMAELKTLGQIAAKLTPVPGNPAPRAHPAAPPSGPAPTVATTVMAVISELTGYPVDMLTLEMDIESDLGIDSIKRVEILSTLESRLPKLPAVAPEDMAKLKTLGQIVAHLDPNASATPRVPAANPPAPQEQPAEVAPSPQRRVIRVAPIEIPPATRPDLPAGRRVYLTTDKAGLSHALAEVLSRSGLRTVQISADILAHRENLPDACGLIIVGDAEGAPGPSSEDDRRLVGHAFDLMKHVGPSLQASAKQGGAFLVTIARMDGQHGFGRGPLGHPLQGALGGLAKTAALEWDDVVCRALDIASDWQDNPRIAQQVAASVFQADTKMPVEIGLDPERACRLALEIAPVDDTPAGPVDLEDNAVVVISGGARGVTAAAALALARSRPLTFILLGRSPQPFDEPAWMHDLNDQAAIKQAIIAHEFAQETPTPQALEAAYRRLMQNREIRTTLADLEAIGAATRYYAVDICERPKLAAVINDVRMVHGPVKALIHGAGILQDRLITAKTTDQFARVFDTKVRGLQNLLAATADDPLQWIVLFSSVAARFGNVGQADYAAANEALNKLAQSEALGRKDCRVKSINWGPWDGGMVSATLKKAFARRGIPLISMTAGTRALTTEMSTAGDDAVEVVIGAELPAAERDPEPETNSSPSRAANDTAATIIFQGEVSLEHYPILDDHRLDGSPVVPMALIAEWLGHGALHDHPGMVLTGLDDMRLLKGIVLENERPRPIRVLTAGRQAHPDGYQIYLELRNGQAPGRGVIHCRATALLSDRFATPPAFTPPPSLAKDDYPRTPKDIYTNILFHGLRLQGLHRVAASSSEGMRAEIATAPAPSRWVKNPARNHWIADPLIMDCAFQMASLWCYEQSGKVSLPSYFSAYRQYSRRFPAGRIEAVLVARELGPHKAIADFYFLDPNRQVVATIHGFEAVMDTHLMQAFKPGRSHAA